MHLPWIIYGYSTQEAAHTMPTCYQWMHQPVTTIATLIQSNITLCSRKLCGWKATNKHAHFAVCTRMFINFRRIRLEYFSSAVLSHIMCSPQQELACFGCVHTNENTPERELPGQSVHITPLHLVCTSVNLTWCGFSHAPLLTKSWKTSWLDCMCQNDLVQRDSSQI